MAPIHQAHCAAEPQYTARYTSINGIRCEVSRTPHIPGFEIQQHKELTGAVSVFSYNNPLL